MKYETMVKIHKLYHDCSLNFSEFTPKDEYTILDLLWYAPIAAAGYLLSRLYRLLLYIYAHRKQLVIAKKPCEEKPCPQSSS